MIQKRADKVKTGIVILITGLLLGTTCAKAGEKQLSTKTLRSMARAYMAFGKYEKAHVLAAQALRLLWLQAPQQLALELPGLLQSELGSRSA